MGGSYLYKEGDVTVGPTKIQRHLCLSYSDAITVIEALKGAGSAVPIAEDCNVVAIIPSHKRIKK